MGAFCGPCRPRRPLGRPGPDEPLDRSARGGEYRSPLTRAATNLPVAPIWTRTGADPGQPPVRAARGPRAPPRGARFEKGPIWKVS